MKNNTSQQEYKTQCLRRINQLLDVCEKHPTIKWISGNGIAVTVRNMETSHIVNVIRKIAPKARLQNEFPYIHEFNEQYYGRKYSEWVEILYNEYKLRAAHEAYNIAVREEEFNNYKDLVDDIPF